MAKINCPCARDAVYFSGLTNATYINSIPFWAIILTDVSVEQKAGNAG
jgi:hypothetical protein